MFLRHAFAFLVSALVATAFIRAADPAPPHTWQRWEHALTSTGSYANPYADVTLRVRFTGRVNNSGVQRFSPSSPGEWVLELVTAP